MGGILSPVRKEFWQNFDKLSSVLQKKVSDIVDELDKNPHSPKYNTEDLGGGNFRTTSDDGDVVVLWKKMQKREGTFVSLVGIRERSRIASAFFKLIDFLPREET